MKRLAALWRTTWWMWLLYFGGSAALCAMVDGRFAFTFPLYVGIFLYFAFVRFDENGERRE